MRRLTRSTIREARNILTLTRARAAGGGAVGVAVPQPTAQNQMAIASATPAWMLLAAPAALGQALITGADPYIPAWGTTFPVTMTFSLGTPANQHAVSHRPILLENDGSANLQIISETDSVDVSALVLSKAPAAGDNEHWVIAHDNLGFSIGYLTSSGTFSATGATDRLTISTAGAFNLTVVDNTALAAEFRDAGGTEYLRFVSTNAQPALVFNEGGADVDFRFEASGEANAVFVQGSDGFTGMGTPAPAGILHLYRASNTQHRLIVDAGGTGDTQTAVLDLMTLGDGTKLIGNAATKGWHFTARSNAYSQAAQQNDLYILYWDGSTYKYVLLFDPAGTVHITENSATVRLSGTVGIQLAIGEPMAETFGQWRLPWACTVTRVDGNVIGGTSCTFNIEERATPGSAGTNVLSSDMAADTNGESVTSGFNNSSLAAGNYLAIDVSAVSGSVDCLSVTLTVTID